MADEHLIPEEFSDAHNAEITEMSDEIAELNQKINDLEQEKRGIVEENKEFKQRVEELKVLVEKLSSEKEDLKNQLEESQSENKAVEAVAARAAELEGEVARLHHDLGSATSDLHESNGDVSELKRELEVVKGREKEKDVKLALLVAEVDAKDKEIKDLKKNVGVVMGNGNRPEMEAKIEEMEEEISILHKSLDEKERVIRDLDGLVISGKNGSIAGLRHSDWLVLGSISIASVAVLGAICYVNAARKY